MRFHAVLRYISFALLLDAIFLAISTIVGVIYGDSSIFPLFYTTLITILVAVFPIIFVPSTTSITNKEGLLIVVGSWLMSCLIGAVPYILWGGEFTFTNAVFESVSGFTTTGSTILQNIEAVPHGLLFWRASTHWIGGIGIIIFVLSVLPASGIVGLVLFRSEVSSVAQENFRQRANKAIQIITGVYLVLTLAEILLLLLFGMNLFDAVTHSFATIATGGFSPKNASIAYYHSVAIETVILIFMILSGIHFVLLFAAVTGKSKQFWKSPVVKYYLLIMLTATIVIALGIHNQTYNSWFDSFRYSAFQVLSVGTSTGFATANSNVWPSYSHLILIFLSLQCAGAGSTSGGIKADRVVLFWKAFVRQIKRVMYPNAVIPIKMGDSSVKDQLVSNSVLYIGVYLMIVFISTLLLSMVGVSLTEAFSGSVATMGNVGPGFGSVGTTGNFSQIPLLGKWIFSIVMLIGRLEIFAFFIFFTPKQWSKSIAY
ncbi:MAG: TrkH family potassium uptake protein [Chlorobi bacterium]|nr:TrkH family potassium uptake protein [Chlorobiota bacterium]